MTARVCSNCRQPLQPGDDICENCGAVLAPVPVPARASAAPATPSALCPTASASAPQACPNCHQPVHPGGDICEQCGAVLISVAGGLPPSTPASAPVPATACPNCHAPRQPTAR